MYISLFYRTVSFFSLFPPFFLRMCRALEAFTTGGGEYWRELRGRHTRTSKIKAEDEAGACTLGQGTVQGGCFAH